MQNFVNSLQRHFMGQSSAAFVLDSGQGPTAFMIPDRMLTNLHHHHPLQRNNTFLQRQLSLAELVALQAMTRSNPVMDHEQQTINDVAKILKSPVGVPQTVMGFPFQRHLPCGSMATSFQGSSLGHIVNYLLAPAQHEGHTNKVRSVGQQQGQGEAASETTTWTEDGSLDSFPFKLYRLLAFVEKEGKTHIISFLPDGTTFKIHDKQAFVAEILPYFFNTNRFASFYRQLNQYSFKRVTKGVFCGGFHNQHFMKGNPLSCKNIIRKKRSPSKKPPPPKSDLPDGASKTGDAPKQAAQVKA